MSWLLHCLLSFVARWLPKREIRVDGQPYLDRYYVCGPVPSHMHCQPRFPRLRPVYLHCFHAPDGDRELHNHPWDHSSSRILVGGYIEERLNVPFEVAAATRARWEQGFGVPPVRTEVYFPGDRVDIDRNAFHRIAVLRRTPTWTLFMPGKRVGKWGFLSADLAEYRNFDE